MAVRLTLQEGTQHISPKRVCATGQAWTACSIISTCHATDSCYQCGEAIAFTKGPKSRGRKGCARGWWLGRADIPWLVPNRALHVASCHALASLGEAHPLTFAILRDVGMAPVHVKTGAHTGSPGQAIIVLSRKSGRGGLTALGRAEDRDWPIDGTLGHQWAGTRHQLTPKKVRPIA